MNTLKIILFETKRSILNNTIKGNVKGGLYENAIGECLAKKGYKLYYYRPDSQHEIEFLIEKNGKVEPVEVKSGNAATPSLNHYVRDFKPTIAYKMIDGNVGEVDGKLSLTHYMAMFLRF